MALEKKQIYLLLIVAILMGFTLAAGAVAYFQYTRLGGQPQTSTAVDRVKAPQAIKNPEPSDDQANVQTPPQQEPQDPRVVYSDGGYLPDPLIVKKGTTVTFENSTQNPMWTASDQHPTHRLYPTTGGCLGSTFDACAGTPPGGTWSFTFDKAGSWNYHNHLYPSNGGTIIVQE